ncbi:S-ribosylhomocysteine lyase [Duncaniella freteri]|uniref:S-ribosylhomocysteine lyase n=1 Tax=Duncaniella freteri TaxID=2530391 RepID=UPI0025736107|nr:S-ribosylhomocysteine lyase [Duncaniella freteri]
MEKIASFTIDHERLLRGIYVSRRDTTPAGDTVTTFDIRMTEPNREPALTPESLHAMEHLAATYLRNRPDWRDRVVYWGPMGCCTGYYLLMQGALEPCDILQLMRDTMDYVASFNGEVPGATSRDCGNYSFMDLAEAKRNARRYLDEVLNCITDENLSYPR